MQRISITIDDNLKHKLDDTVPKGERAAFVSKAIEKELIAREKQEAIDYLLNFKRYKVDKPSVEIVREMRSERADYLASRHQTNHEE